jgi:hypothetical protein
MQYFKEIGKPPNPLMIEGAGGVDAPKALFYCDLTQRESCGKITGKEVTKKGVFLCLK